MRFPNLFSPFTLKSTEIRNMLHELQNSVITAVLLVVIIMLLALGGRASIFIGIAIPASFLAGILGLQGQIEKLRVDIKERDERIRRLSEELRKLKAIDMQRRPSRPKE